MQNKEFFASVANQTGVNMFTNNPMDLPANDEELALHMQVRL